jgi:hypothetical protein
MEYKYTKNDKEILTNEEQEIIVQWVKKNYLRLKKNGEYKYMKSMYEIPDIPKIVWEIRKRIVEKENLQNAKQDPLFKDTIGCMLNGGQLHKHTDPNIDDLIHTRFNVYVQLPNEGGYPIYDDKTYKLKERTYICCRAGLDYHCCEKVIGDRERIILSYGFLLPKERVENIKYEY